MLPNFQYNLPISLILEAHVERKKSKSDYILDTCSTDE